MDVREVLSCRMSGQIHKITCYLRRGGIKSQFILWRIEYLISTVNRYTNKKRLSRPYETASSQQINIMNYIQLITLMLLILSCKNQVQKQQVSASKNIRALPRVEIRPPQGNLPNLKLSEIATDIEYIKLETSKEVLLGDGFAYYSPISNFIFVTSGGRIFQFNRSGKFIRNIGMIGKGPNEFILHRMDVDFQNKIIYIFPRWTNKILKFNFDGKPLGQTKNDLVGYPALMKVLDDQLIFVNEINQYLRKDNKGGHMELYSFNPRLNKVNYYLPNPYHFPENTNTFSNKTIGQEHLQIIKNSRRTKNGRNDESGAGRRHLNVPTGIFYYGICLYGRGG